MTWQEFPLIVGGSIGFWTLGVGFGSFRRKSVLWNQLSKLFLSIGSLIIISFLVLLWSSLDRPPLRTLGETRLWYATLLPFVGFLVQYRWGIKWLTTYCVGLASVFLLINLTNPETYDKTLMPALQSIWFVPHVIVYMVSYALLAAFWLVAFRGLYLQYRGKSIISSSALPTNS